MRSVSDSQIGSGSSYIDEAHRMRDRLNAVSPSFCLAKWLHVSLQLTTGRTQSCYHPAPHPIPIEELKSDPGTLHNTSFKKEMRKRMLEGTKPSECQYCWNVENLGPQHLSDRHYRSSESWAAPRFDEVKSLPWDADINPSYVEVNFNHACQLKCSYCSPHISSSWMAEVVKHGPFPTRHGHNRLDWFKKNHLIPIPYEAPNPYLDAFWEWWPKIYPTLKYFRMTGGEPLLDPNTFRVFEYALANPNPDLTLSLTSNFCTADSHMSRFFENIRMLREQKAIKGFELYVSIDSAGAQAEYIRNGLNYAKFMFNVERYLDENPRNSIHFIITYCNLALFGLKNLLEKIQELRARFNVEAPRVHFDTPMLTQPYFLSLQILPKEFVGRVDELIAYMKERVHQPGQRDGFLGAEIARMERVRAWMSQEIPTEILTQRMADFYLFFAEHDRRRGTDFHDAFPELHEFWRKCELSSKMFPSFETVLKRLAAENGHSQTSTCQEPLE